MKIENEESPFTNSCLFTLDRLPLLLLLYAETSSSVVQKRHSKVYGNPIAPSFYSISPCVKLLQQESFQSLELFSQTVFVFVWTKLIPRSLITLQSNVYTNAIPPPGIYVTPLVHVVSCTRRMFINYDVTFMLYKSFRPKTAFLVPSFNILNYWHDFATSELLKSEI